MKKFIKIFTFIYILYTMLEIIVCAFYLPKISIDNYRYAIPFMNNSFMRYFHNGVYSIILLVLAIGIYRFNDLARRLLIFRYQILGSFLVVENILAFILYGNVFKYDLLHLITFVFTFLECAIIIFLFTNKKVKAIYPIMKASKKEIFFAFVTAYFFVISGVGSMDGFLKFYNEEMSYYTAYSYYSKKDYRSALSNFLNSTTLGNKRRVIDALYKTGNCYYHLKDYEKAREYYQKVILLNDKYVNAYIALESIYFKKDDFDNAKKCLRKVLEVDPNNAEGRKRLDDIEKIEKEYKKLKEHLQ